MSMNTGARRQNVFVILFVLHSVNNKSLLESN